MENTIDKSTRLSYPHTTYVELLNYFELEMDDLLQTPITHGTLKSIKHKIFKVMGSAEMLGFHKIGDALRYLFSDPLNEQFLENLKSCRAETFEATKNIKG